MTSAAAVNAILIDDNRDDRETFRRLEKYGVPCSVIPPPSLSAVQDDVVAAVNDGIYNLVLIDFLLDQEAQEHGQSANYRGSTAAALVKERCPHIPVVLVTTEDKYHDYIEHRPELGALFDFVLPKNQVRTTEDRMIVAESLKDLALGFQRLRLVIESEDAETRWEKLREALAATDEEFRSLRDEWPNDLPGSASELARWLLKELLKYPGPLRDNAETAVIMGVTQTAMNDEAIREWAAAASYTGIFAGIHKRWWSSRLLAALDDLLGECALLPSGPRAVALVDTLGLQGSHIAQCSWCGEANVHRVCVLCRESVDATHHLRVRQSETPVWALPKVVCFGCIEAGADEGEGIHYGAGTADLIEDLRTGRLQSA